MTPYVRFVLAGALAILAFDTVGSLISLASGISYGWFTVGSVLIYVGFAYMAAPRFGKTRAVLGTVIVALTEATLGWAISWAIGPGRPAQQDATPLAVVVTSVFVGGLIGSFLGLVGARLALRNQQMSG